MRTSFQSMLLIGLSVITGYSCTITGNDELFATAVHVEGIVSSSKDGSAISAATVRLMMGTIDGLVAVKTAQTDATGRYVINHSFNMGRNRCPPVWIASSAPGYVATTPQDPRYRLVCEAMTINGRKQTSPSRTIHVALVPDS